jgi:hypothetical protein
VRFSIRLSGSSFFVTIYVDVHSIVVHETDVELEAAFSSTSVESVSTQPAMVSTHFHLRHPSRADVF